jgi:hypothetical protein
MTHLRQNYFQRGALFALLLAAGAFSSCKKDEGDAGLCRISGLDWVNGTDTTVRETFTYNKSGMISQRIMKATDVDVWNYEYSGNRIGVTHTSGVFLIGRDSMIRNARGLITFLRLYEQGSSTGWWENILEYNDSDQLIRTTVNAPGGHTGVVTYNWQDGNMVSNSNGDVYEYYTDQAARPGDYHYGEMSWPQGAPFYRNRNMIRGVYPSGGTPVLLSYAYDADGRVTEMRIESHPGPMSLFYRYACD